MHVVISPANGKREQHFAFGIEDAGDVLFRRMMEIAGGETSASNIQNHVVGFILEARDAESDGMYAFASEILVGYESQTRVIFTLDPK